MTELYDPQPLIQRVLEYANRAGIKPSYASTRVFGDGSRLERLQQGKTCTLKTAKEAMERLDDLFDALDNTPEPEAAS